MAGNYSEIFVTTRFTKYEEIFQMNLLFLALAVTTFYRKSFTFTSQGIVIFVDILGYIIWSWDSLCFPHISNIVVLIYKILIMFFTINNLSNDVKTLDLQDVLNVCVMYMFLRWVVIADYNPAHLWRTVLMISPLQLVRKPLSLKNALRRVRVSAGPVSIILAMLAGYYQICNTTYRGFLATSLLILPSVLVILSAVVAGVVFRPDNTEVLTLVLPYTVKYARRVEIHALGNGVILIIALGMVLAHGL